MFITYRCACMRKHMHVCVVIFGHVCLYVLGQRTTSDAIIRMLSTFFEIALIGLELTN